MSTSDVRARLGKLARRGLRLAGRERLAFGGWIDVATWLSEDVLLLLGWFDAPDAEPVAGGLVHEGREIPFEMRVVSYSRADVAIAGARSGKIAVARLTTTGPIRGAFGPLIVRRGGDSAWLGPEALSDAVTTLTNFGERLGVLEPETRQAALELLSAVNLSSFTSRADGLLRRNVLLLRESVRATLPGSVTVAGDRPELVVDVLLAVDERRFCLIGWMHAGQAHVRSLTVVTPEGERIDVLDRVFRVARPDVKLRGASTDDPAQVGFRCTFEAAAPTRAAEGWSVEMRDDAGGVVETAAPAAVSDPLTVRSALLAELARERLLDPELMERHYFPLLSAVQERLNQPVAPVDVLQYGAPPADPGVSVIVPLYGQIQFLEHQLAQFTSDPEIRTADLIYVLDSPEFAEDLRGLAGHLFAIYGVPFRLAILPRNVGFAAANNAGVSLARAPLVLLLNSDILPDGPGWLARMAAFYHSTPGIGALAPKLLFEDDSLQHAGMYFRPAEDPGVWENLHFYKGMHRSVPAANVTRRVPAVTAACLMIDRGIYQDLGGLRSIYVQGDYEDSDLCLRLTEAGYDNWYLPTVELYHLEGQSYPGELRAAASRYNRWLHSRLWASAIERAMSADGRPGSAGAIATVEIDEIFPIRFPDGMELLLESPQAGSSSEAYSFDLTGRIAGAGRTVAAVELREGTRLHRTIPIDDGASADVGGHQDAAAEEEGSSFGASVSVLGLPSTFELSVIAVFKDESRRSLAHLRGRRQLLPVRGSSTIKPLIITTYGRSGSTYLTALLGCHPQILAYGPFELEPRLAGYWTQVFRTLSDPSSYSQALTTVLSSQHWWLGADDGAPLHAPDADVRRWLERTSIESLATFCRQRVQAFYREVGASQQRREASFFVEKNPPPNFFSRTLVFELFPGGREIFLVRDFRDMISSILAHNARTGRVTFGREQVETDEDFVLWIRGAAQALLTAYQQRSADVFLVRYEDLVTDTAAILEGILEFLDLEGGAPTATAMIERARAAFASVEGSHITSRSVPASIGRWRHDLNPRLQKICGDAFGEILSAFGYQ